jgi:hypothetical protein
MRVLLDTMVFDNIAADDELKRCVLTLIERGEMAILSTHVQQQQLAAIKDDAKRAAIATIPREVIATGGAMWDHSAWDAALWTNAEAAARIDEVFRGNPNDIPDALIASTLSYADRLVTSDRRLRNRLAKNSPDKVWTFDEFRKFVAAAG